MVRFPDKSSLINFVWFYRFDCKGKSSCQTDNPGDFALKTIGHEVSCVDRSWKFIVDLFENLISLICNPLLLSVILIYERVCASSAGHTRGDESSDCIFCYDNKESAIVKLCKTHFNMTTNSSMNERQLDKPVGMSDFVAGEVWNGRLAMIGFISAIATEVLLGQSLLPKMF